MVEEREGAEGQRERHDHAEGAADAEARGPERVPHITAQPLDGVHDDREPERDEDDGPDCEHEQEVDELRGEERPPGQSSKAAVTPIRMAAMAPLAAHRKATMLSRPATLTGVGMFERIRSRSMPASWARGKLSTILSMSSERRSSFWRMSPKIETRKTSRGTSEKRTWYAIAAASWEQ